MRKNKHKQGYNKRTGNGWIGEQFCLNKCYIEKFDFTEKMGIYLVENDVELMLSPIQLKILKALIKEFDRWHRI